MAQLAWDLEGRILHQKVFGRNGEPHGFEFEYFTDGRVRWCARWVAGLQDGPVLHLSEDGCPILLSTFCRGRGVDLWVNCGRVTELREVEGGVPHGLVRWGDPASPEEEGRYKHGLKHGVFRRWDRDSESAVELEFYVQDRRVTRDAYESANGEDATLPVYRPDDDLNRRAMPEVIVAALRRAKQLAVGFSLDEFLRANRPPDQ